ncbi:MAG: hypothetical protein M1818_004809 [Claussenomyces sp. TS43310]|nr:MAG: hypothetical protein M1818_004809 [Claussenomyces sp. TS43310]
MTVEKMKLAVLYLALSFAHAQSIFPITATSVSLTLTPIATGTAVVTLVPFDVDFTSLPDYQTNNSVFVDNLNSAWTSEVTVYDDTQNFLSFLSLSWPDGEGPGAPAVGHDDETWSACLIAFPDLFSQLNITNAGNGTCYDVMPSECLYYILTNILSLWDMSIGGHTNVTDAALAQACQVASSNILQSTQCFGQSANWTENMRGYPITTPTNEEPFLLRVDTYNASHVQSKSDLQDQVLSKAWPLVILEAEGNYSVQATMTCPHAGPAQKDVPPVLGS